MLTYSFEDRGEDNLYEYLYKQIKRDIKVGRLESEERLPSKRALARHLDISTITVENAYNQLVAEGYIYSIPRSGFYVSDISASDIWLKEHKNIKPHKVEGEMSTQGPEYFIDFVSNSTAHDNFPFATWSKLLREIISQDKKKLMTKSPSTGVYQLRSAIANYLYEFRGIDVEPDQVVVGAGTEYLYGLIIQLLGYDKKYAVEDPGYQKVSHIYEANNVETVHIPLDESGVSIDALEKFDGDILHITPSHHFPTGIVTPINRRQEILSWASKCKDRFIIEDDYDSEFRLVGRPIPALQSIDPTGKVIYINTFSKSLTSTIRISYMVLPRPLMERYNKELSFYSCTVSNFEQYTLAKFINEGYFEKHINRMRTYYKKVRNDILSSIRRQTKGKKGPRIMEENAGLHFLLEVDTNLTDTELVKLASEKGINLSCLSQYYYNKKNKKEHTLLINYSGVNINNVEKGVDMLFNIF